MRKFLNIVFVIAVCSSAMIGNYLTCSWIFSTMLWCNMYYNQIEK